MQAIETKYFPTTNIRGSRIKATCARGTLTIPYPHEFNAEDAHKFAAEQLKEKFCQEDVRKGQPGVWWRESITGVLKNGNHVHVFIPIE